MNNCLALILVVYITQKLALAIIVSVMNQMEPQYIVCILLHSLIWMVLQQIQAKWLKVTYCLSIADVLGGPHERRLLNDLLEHYNTLERPVYNESEPLQLLFGLTLQQIIDVVSMTWANFKKIFTFKHFRVGLRKLGTE